jgi:adenylate kinase
MNIVIFGPPGAGKGTQSKFIVKKFNLFQLSTGELLRNEIINKTKLGLNISSTMNSGNLVSDNIVSDLIEKYISSNNFKETKLLKMVNGETSIMAITKQISDLIEGVKG